MSSDPEKKLIWENLLASAIERRHQSVPFTLLGSNQMVGTAVLIFVRESLIPMIRNVEFASKKTGLGGMAGNKGSMAVRFDICESSVCFVCSHFSAGNALGN